MHIGAGKLDVVERRQLAVDAVELTLRRPDLGRLSDWTPGAHVALTLPNGMVRPYSLCGDRWDPCTYTVAVRRDVDGTGGSAYLHDVLRVGDVVGVGTPRNSFPLVPATSYVFVAGGIGITPFLPMIQAAAGLDIPFRLLYIGRDIASMPYVDDLLTGPRAEHVEVHTTSDHGRPDLAEAVGPLTDGARVYACGPADMSDVLEDLARSWPDYTLRTEAFARPKALETDEPFTAELRRTGATITVPRRTSLLEAIQTAGVDILSSCRAGSCGACETPVLHGEVDHRDTILADGDVGVMFPCVSRAREGLVVLDL
ncbi:PDR/VanB family oxidoreductase [Isoptericola halotolerans]|uniref:PDR/VanB family oxidoreductase n=1 Tax=Isoptericola halotolerans TaxID=300560 RepID=UPI0038903E23